MRLVVGLGNPGRKYEATRHNAGFWLVERLAARLGASPKTDAKFHGRAARLPAQHGGAWLLMPDTYMNCSGRSVAALAGFYKIPAADVLVVHDELDLPPGTARLKRGGGTGGHNGVTDIASALGTRDFWRLRIGIGHPGVRDEVVDYVLRAPRAEEAAQIEDAIDRSLDVWSEIVAGDMNGAMMKLHTREAGKAKPEDRPGGSDGERSAPSRRRVPPAGDAGGE